MARRPRVAGRRGEVVDPRLGIRTRSPHTLVKELSGGNQQKVLFAKWLSVEPDLLVLHEPTQAVDVGARVDILRAVAETAAHGVGVLLVSIEPADLADVCDRILVSGREEASTRSGRTTPTRSCTPSTPRQRRPGQGHTHD